MLRFIEDGAVSFVVLNGTFAFWQWAHPDMLRKLVEVPAFVFLIVASVAFVIGAVAAICRA